ncbi:hypothetical protein [Actinokineospora sp.]|uniref:hypothetical protein n=1 Tax=Actinokineospora sp. TaxID=1872133 RepID=UPI004037F4BC
MNPVRAEAFYLLRYSLYEYLDEAELFASGHEWSEEDIDAAQAVIPDLCDVIRMIVIEHADEPDGRCRVCATEWPCPVVQTVNRKVKDKTTEFGKLIARMRERTFDQLARLR